MLKLKNETVGNQLADITLLLQEVHYCNDRELLSKVLRVARHAVDSVKNVVDDWYVGGVVLLPLGGQDDEHSSELTAGKVALALADQKSFDAEQCIARILERYKEIRRLRRSNGTTPRGEEVAA
jgi:hypothetical protein